MEFSKLSSFDLAFAIADIFQSESIKKSPTISVIYVKTKSGDFISKSLITKTIELMNKSRAIRIEDHKKLEIIKNRRRTLSVFFIKDFKSFQELSFKITADRFHIDGYYLIVLFKGMIPEVQNIFDIVWKKYIYNVNILVKETQLITLITFKPIGSKSCRNTTPIIINRYNIKSRTWQFKKHFPKKFSNLMECPIKVSTFETIPSVMVQRSHRNGSVKLKGSGIEIFYEIAKILNFNIEMHFINKPGSFGDVFENGTGTGAIKKLLDNEVEMILGNYFLTELRAKFMSNTDSYYTNPWLFVIPPGSPLSPFEKLFRPFNIVVWICLVSTFIISVIIIAIVNCQSFFIKDLIFGRQIRNPYLNLVIAFVGGSQHILPKRNFSRTLLMCFLIFCLVMRNLYLSGLFEFLQSDQRAKEVASVDEINEKGFTVYLEAPFAKTGITFFNKYFIIELFIAQT
ncbi:unnamed protein product [Diamesa serratosioi]